jgi:hypothetical protein
MLAEVQKYNNSTKRSNCKSYILTFFLLRVQQQYQPGIQPVFEQTQWVIGHEADRVSRG